MEPFFFRLLENCSDQLFALFLSIVVLTKLESFFVFLLQYFFLWKQYKNESRLKPLWLAFSHSRVGCFFIFSIFWELIKKCQIIVLKEE